MPPTSANCSPCRIVFVKTPAAREKLKGCLMAGNVEQTMAAPVAAIIAHDMEFYEKLPELYPFTDARSWFVGNDAAIKATAVRNGTLQGGYFMLAARAMGLSVGPRSGFDEDKVDETFLSGTTYVANFLCNLGFGTFDKVYPRAPRMTFEDACQVV